MTSIITRSHHGSGARNRFVDCEAREVCSGHCVGSFPKLRASRSMALSLAPRAYMSEQFQLPRSPLTVSANEKERPFHCPVEHCERRFNRKYTLSEHLKTHTGDKPHACRAAGCDRRFATSSNLSRHMRIHGPLPLMRCPREGCSRSFLSDVQLARHLRQHDAPRTHPCTVARCTKTFSTIGNLNRHLKKHCTGTNREELACSAFASWGVGTPMKRSPTGVEKDCGADVGASVPLAMDIIPAPIEKPCDEPWSPETLEILGHMLLS